MTISELVEAINTYEPGEISSPAYRVVDTREFSYERGRVVGGQTEGRGVHVYRTVEVLTDKQAIATLYMDDEGPEVHLASVHRDVAFDLVPDAIADLARKKE